MGGWGVGVAVGWVGARVAVRWAGASVTLTKATLLKVRWTYSFAASCT